MKKTDPGSGLEFEICIQHRWNSALISAEEGTANGS
jgi:hypothetical protein